MLKWWRRVVHRQIKRRKAVPEILAQPNARKRRRVEKRFDVFETGVDTREQTFCDKSCISYQYVLRIQAKQ